MTDISDLPEDERGILRLLDASATMQQERHFASTMQMLDLGDRILAQQIVKQIGRASCRERVSSPV